jgi:hypothetical protein
LSPHDLELLLKQFLRGYKTFDTLATFNFPLKKSAAKLKRGMNTATLKKIFDEAGDKVSVHN